MFTKNELLDAIDELEMSPATFQNCQKLATFYTLYEHLYERRDPVSLVESVEEVIMDQHGDSEFLRLVDGKSAETAWKTMNELMDAVKALQPRLYDATLQRFRNQV